MKLGNETNLALFVDFDNVALGARDARQRFDIQIVLQRLLEKGKIIVKRAYADWSHHKEYLADLHQAGLELIEIPSPQMSGKNSADIRLVVDAMDLCYGKEHLDTFVIVSGDSDFTPLVSKLRENGKSVIGVGVRNSSSHLLIVNCDEFIFYDDLYLERVSQQVEGLTSLPGEKRKLFDFLLTTIQGLMRESRGVLYSSLIKDTMKRKQPEFNEHKYGYANFGDLLEDAMEQGLLRAERDSRAGGTWVVSALGKGLVRPAPLGTGRNASPRKRNGRGRRRREASREAGGEDLAARAAAAPATPPAPASTAESPVASHEVFVAAGATAGETERHAQGVGPADKAVVEAPAPPVAEPAEDTVMRGAAGTPSTSDAGAGPVPSRRGRRGRKTAKAGPRQGVKGAEASRGLAGTDAEDGSSGAASARSASGSKSTADQPPAVEEVGGATRTKGEKKPASRGGRSRQKTVRKKPVTRRKSSPGGGAASGGSAED